MPSNDRRLDRIEVTTRPGVCKVTLSGGGPESSADFTLMDTPGAAAAFCDRSSGDWSDPDLLREVEAAVLAFFAVGDSG